MKELEKTRRIYISVILFLLVIIIGSLAFKIPVNNFTKSAEQTLEFVKNQSHLMSFDNMQKIDKESYTLIDVRSNFDYSNGHIEHAINIPKSQLLESESREIIETIPNTNRLLIVYGENPETAHTACILLFQLGYEPLKLLTVESFYEDQEFHIKNVEVEKPMFNFSETMEKSKIPIIKKITAKPKPQPAKKKVVVKPKKKKKMPEGGC